MDLHSIATIMVDNDYYLVVVIIRKFEIISPVGDGSFFKDMSIKLTSLTVFHEQMVVRELSSFPYLENLTLKLDKTSRTNNNLLPSVEEAFINYLNRQKGGSRLKELILKVCIYNIDSLCPPFARWN